MPKYLCMQRNLSAGSGSGGEKPSSAQMQEIVLALKTLCGFDVREITLRLFTSEANVYKRLGRARNRLRELPPRIEELRREHYGSRLPAVHRILYLLFTEGYLSSHAESAIRRELCDEAIRLAVTLAAHPVGRTPETLALVALMQLHAARITARQDASGGLLLLGSPSNPLPHRRSGICSTDACRPSLRAERIHGRTPLRFSRRGLSWRGALVRLVDKANAG